jgi:hypothetical protein
MNQFRVFFSREMLGTRDQAGRSEMPCQRCPHCVAIWDALDTKPVDADALAKAYVRH